MTADCVATIRRFNRFHTRLVGALDEKVLHSRYPLPQVRVLYEIANAPPGQPPSAADLGRLLGMDAGYLSRLVGGLESEGLVERAADADHGRRLVLRLTAAGRDEFARMNAASAAEVEALIAGLGDAGRAELAGAMARVEALLGGTPTPRAFVLRDPEPGDLGVVITAQARLYTAEYGWDGTFEGMLADIVAAFIRSADRADQRCWIAEADGRIVGSVMVVRGDETTAQLRMLYVDAAARGMGLGRRLVDEAIRFAAARHYGRMILWTNDILVSARRIYEAAGFHLVAEEPHTSFGKSLVGQTWERPIQQL